MREEGVPEGQLYRGSRNKNGAPVIAEAPFGLILSQTENRPVQL